MKESTGISSSISKSSGCCTRNEEITDDFDSQLSKMVVNESDQEVRAIKLMAEIANLSVPCYLGGSGEFEKQIIKSGMAKK